MRTNKMNLVGFLRSNIFHLIILIDLGFVIGQRAIENSPSGSYLPIREICPIDFTINDHSTSIISENEQSYIRDKTQKSIKSWETYLTRLNLTDFDQRSFLGDQNLDQIMIPGRDLPNIGFAASGGGHRAMLYSASILAAFDGRNLDDSNNNRSSGTVGILQLINYLAGLSGGAWMVGSWAAAGFPDLNSMQNSAWKLKGDENYIKLEIGREYPSIMKDIKQKKRSGFPVSVVDLWGRFVAGKLIDAPNNAEKVLFSSIKETKSYQERSVPFPILVAVSRSGTTNQLNLDSPIYEFTPEDFSVSHPGLNSSMSIQYLGTRSSYSSTRVVPECVVGFENIGFVLGVTSNIFTSYDSSQSNHSVWSKVTTSLGSQSIYEGLVPNPFQGLGQPDVFPDYEAEVLKLADGGSAGEKLPLFPLIHRNLDVIFASDASIDGGPSLVQNKRGYPNGTSLYLTYLKTQQPGYQGYRFPEIPNAFDGTFQQRGYHKRPTFFGCDAGLGTPIVIYLPNYFVVAPTDMMTGTITFTDEQIRGFFNNGRAIATQSLSSLSNGSGGNTTSTDWASCLGCALIDRQNTRNGNQRTSQCQKCFQVYCG